MKKNQLIALLVFIVFFASCKNEKAEEEPTPVPPASSMTLKVSYEVDGISLVYDSLMYSNAAGNNYSVYMLQYFLSQISLIKSDSSKVLMKDYHYFDATIASTNQFTIENIPEGGFIGVSFNIGIDPAHNITGALPNNTNNNNMEWPEPMGGGYHFMKFEGHFLNVTGDTLYGFNMHLGKNENLVKVEIYAPVYFNHGNFIYNMTMNLNEWFKNPYTYNFNTDGNYTMADSLAMHKISSNGTDVFTHH
ncbi:MAG: hypothetical protein NT126_00080 [Bacteroidetes bacterium]|nr:hypothetical protein [Bacteroidota bacterium]